MAKTFTIQDFFTRFPTHDACLDHLMKVRFGERLKCPKCGREGKFHRVKKRQVYQCAWCAHQVSPMVGTPFERSSTPLQKWFYAMYLFTTSRHGVPAKELQRQLGVTYKTAWRMGHEIRKYMGKIDGDPPLTGHVEVDETYVGGRRKGRGVAYGGRSGKDKTIVMGILEREGEVFTKIVPNASRASLIPPVVERVKRGARISTDEWRPYRILTALGYDHETVDHASKQWAVGDVHTNALEGFWSMLKRSIRGTHIHVSQKHLPKYLGEFEYRFNMRKQPELMFAQLLLSFSR